MDAGTARRHDAAATMREQMAAAPVAPGRSNPLSLAVALAITLGITVYPHALAAPDGTADHWTAVTAFWAMSAGYVAGVGFQPRRLMFRILFSGATCIVALGLAVARMAWLWQ